MEEAGRGEMMGKGGSVWWKSNEIDETDEIKESPATFR